MANDVQPASIRVQAARPFRRAVLRGLAGLCPPLLTVLIIVWAITTIKSYLLEPVTDWAREGLVWCIADIRDDVPLWSRGKYHQLENGQFIPKAVFERVRDSPANRCRLRAKGSIAATSS